jgi:hypothetical protein
LNSSFEVEIGSPCNSAGRKNRGFEYDVHVYKKESDWLVSLGGAGSAI